MIDIVFSPTTRHNHAMKNGVTFCGLKLSQIPEAIVAGTTMVNCPECLREYDAGRLRKRPLIDRRLQARRYT